MNKTLAIIPARKGSKGVRKKNKQLIHGKPLIQYSIDVVKDTHMIDEAVISTDDDEIIEISKQNGVPFIKRKKNISNDDSPIELSIEEVLNEFSEFQNICLLQPTSPLRKPKEIASAINIFNKTDRKRTLVSVFKVDDHHPSRMYRKSGNLMKPLDELNFSKRRQDLEDLYLRNGCFYIFDRSHFLQEKKVITKNIIPFIMPIERSINIDNYQDIELLKIYLSNNL